MRQTVTVDVVAQRFTERQTRALAAVERRGSATLLDLAKT